jgi:hypothetical protein
VRGCHFSAYLGLHLFLFNFFTFIVTYLLCEENRQPKCQTGRLDVQGSTGMSGVKALRVSQEGHNFHASIGLFVESWKGK